MEVRGFELELEYRTKYMFAENIRERGRFEKTERKIWILLKRGAVGRKGERKQSMMKVQKLMGVELVKVGPVKDGAWEICSREERILQFLLVPTNFQEKKSHIC